jgi:hypothetical protein
VLPRAVRVAAIALALVTFPAAVAHADPPPDCPDAPAAYTGSDPVVSELRDGRVDERAACLALAGRLDRVADATDTAAAAAHTDSAAVQSHVDLVTDAVHAIPTPTAPTSDPSSYDGPTSAHAGELVDELHVDVRGLQWLAWFLAGLLVVVIVRPSVSRWWAQ